MAKPTHYEIVYFEDYLIPKGFLTSDMECHALFYYYICTAHTIEKFNLTKASAYEGEEDNNVNLPALFKSIANMYKVEPEKMENYWDLVDMQCFSLGEPVLWDKFKDPCKFKILKLN